MRLFNSLESIDEKAFVSSNIAYNISISDALLLQEIIVNLGFENPFITVNNMQTHLSLDEYLERGADPSIAVEVRFHFPSKDGLTAALIAKNFQKGIWIAFQRLYDETKVASSPDAIQGAFNQIPQLHTVWAKTIEKVALKGII